MHKIRKGVSETPFQPTTGEPIILTTDSIITLDKDNEIQSDRQYHSCVYCPSWTRCTGYYQLKICKGYENEIQ